MSTEFMQPINPIRVWQKGQLCNFCHPVFAIAISNSHDVEYLTINGMFLTRQHIMYAEQYIDGKWCPIGITPTPNVSSTPLEV